MTADDRKREVRDLLNKYSHITSLMGVSHLAAEAAIDDALSRVEEATAKALREAAQIVKPDSPFSPHYVLRRRLEAAIRALIARDHG